MKYAYTAIFEPEDGGYVVSFPDVDGCITEGDTLQEAIYMAQDALCLMLYSMEVDAREIPAATDPRKIKAPEGAFTSVITVDTEHYRRFYDSKAVKKTLTIPSWLNTLAENANAPYSQILQNGLKNYLGIDA